MKLYITPGSPYARMARIVVLEKGLESRVEIITAKTRVPDDGEPWEARRLEALARSMLDGLSVWGREILRPENERSPGVMRHETERARRMADAWEREIAHRLMRGPLSMIQITLACALGLEARNPGFRWRAGARSSRNGSTGSPRGRLSGRQRRPLDALASPPFSCWRASATSSRWRLSCS